MSTRSGDELVEMLLAGEDIPGEEGRAANDLLREIARGYPAENLSRLIPRHGWPWPVHTAWRTPPPRTTRMYAPSPKAR